MDTLEIIKFLNYTAIFGIMLFYLYRLRLSRSGPPGQAICLESAEEYSFSSQLSRKASERAGLVSREAAPLSGVEGLLTYFIGSNINRRGIAMSTPKFLITKMVPRTILSLTLLVLWCVAPAFAADRGRILSTQEQQYQNMVLNGSLESFSSGTTSAPDGYVAEGLSTGTGSVARNATSKFQSYGVQLTQTNTAGTYTLKYNTAITNFGNSLTGDSADLTTTEWQRLTLYSNNGYVASVWVKLPGGATNPTAVTLKTSSDGKLYVEMDSDTTGDYCYIDGMQITEGPIAPAFVNAAISDTGNQVVYGTIKAQDPASSAYIQLTPSGTFNLGSNVSLTSAGALDLGPGADDDLTAADVTDITDGGSTILHTHVGLAPGAHADTHMTGDDKVYWSSLSKANGDATSVATQISNDIATHTAIAGAHHAVATVSGAGLDISGQQVSLDVAPSAGSATLIETEDALQVKYSATYLTESASGLELATGYATGSTYDTRFVNISGTESMEGPLTIGKTYSSLSGTDIAAQVSPTINQASAGTAGYTALLVKTTETALAGYSGTKLLLDLQAGASPATKLSVDNSGNVTSVGNITLSTVGAAVDGVDLDSALTGLTQGSGITITGSGHTRAITNADTGSSQLFFKTITDGSTNAAADINNDTFKMRSANNILGVAVSNDDATHGDSALFTITQGNIDHGSIAGLADDDHAQYGALAQNESVTGAWTFANDTTVNSAATTTDALTIKGEALLAGNLIKARINADTTTGNIMYVTDDAATPLDKFKIDKGGAITVGTIPWASVSSKPNLVNSITQGGGVTASSSTGDITLGTSVTVSNTTATYSTGNAYSLIQHMQAIGSGTITADNAHGLNYVDVGASSSGHNHDAAYINDGAGEVNNSNDFNFASSTFITNLDADKLDGQTGTYYLDTSSGAQVKSGAMSFTGNVTMGDNAADTVILASQAATDATVADSPTLYLRGSYDSNPAGGSLTATSYDAAITHNLLTTGPTSNLEFNIAGGAAEMTLDNSGNLATAGTINSQTIGASSSFSALTATGDLIVNQNSGTADDVYFAVQHGGVNKLTIDREGDLTVEGDFTVNGDQTILNVQTVEVESSELVMNRNITANPSLNASITVNRGTAGGVDRSIRWNETSDIWEVSNDGSTYVPLGGDINATYLVNSASTVLTSEIVTSSLGQDLSIKGNAAASRAITIGQQAANADVINFDVPSSNFKIGGSQISATNLSDGANIAHINAAETISANWVNTANPWANNEVADDLTISGGTINNSIIGASTSAAATFTNLTASGTLDFPNDSVAMADINWSAGQILITPEYPNASLYGDGTNNNGTLALKNTDDANWRNYYEWTSQVTILQDYTIVDRYVLPPDFSSWATTNAIKLGFVTGTALAADNKVDVIVYKSGNATLVYQTTGNVSSGWTEIAISAANLSGATWAAGDIVVIKIIVYSKSGNFARIGDITLNYTR